MGPEERLAVVVGCAEGEDGVTAAACRFGAIAEGAGC